MVNLTTERFHIQLEETIRLQIALLGGFRVWVDAHLIPTQAWKRRKVQALIKLLALSSKHCLHREQLMELLWPEAEIMSARNNLRQTLHLARHIFKSEANSDSGPSYRSQRLALPDTRRTSMGGCGGF